MIVLSKDQVIALHAELISETGGVSGVLDNGLLESALNAPFQGYGGVELYPSIQQKAARLGYGLVNNHAFADGNKRIGAHVMLVFLMLNGIELEYTQAELVEIILDVAAGRASHQDLLLWLLNHQA